MPARTESQPQHCPPSLASACYSVATDRDVTETNTCSDPAFFPVCAVCRQRERDATGGVRDQELCESRGGCPGFSVLTSLMISVDVKEIFEPCSRIGLSLSPICQPTSEDIKQHNSNATGM